MRYVKQFENFSDKKKYIEKGNGYKIEVNTENGELIFSPTDKKNITINDINGLISTLKKIANDNP